MDFRVPPCGPRKVILSLRATWPRLMWPPFRRKTGLSQGSETRTIHPETNEMSLQQKLISLTLKAKRSIITKVRKLKFYSALVFNNIWTVYYLLNISDKDKNQTQANSFRKEPLNEYSGSSSSRDPRYNRGGGANRGGSSKGSRGSGKGGRGGYNTGGKENKGKDSSNSDKQWVLWHINPC